LLAAGLTLFFVQSPRHHSWRFDSLLEARVIIEGWRCDYCRLRLNREQPAPVEK